VRTAEGVRAANRNARLEDNLTTLECTRPTKLKRPEQGRRFSVNIESNPIHLYFCRDLRFYLVVLAVFLLRPR